ncbi:MAG: Rrf2 family transcriptional regulator [bacterium]|nr:Rrf2 family transcriptional regulator [bacterium]MDT8396534.1 Rrf2 family transcriptional regulator [bacterium]
MRLSTKSRYGVRALFDIAYHSVGLPTQIKDISRRQQISPRYLEQIFQKLKKAGLLGSKRGPNGGYYLLKDPADITLGDIVRATEGPFQLVFCASEAPRKKCPRSDDCVAQKMWLDISNQIGDFFDAITISDLCARARIVGVEREYDHPYTYQI